MFISFKPPSSQLVTPFASDIIVVINSLIILVTPLVYDVIISTCNAFVYDNMSLCNAYCYIWELWLCRSKQNHKQFSFKETLSARTNYYN